MAWQSKALTLRRLKFWLLLVLLGTLANSTVVDLPFVVPFSIGNVALFLILLRLGLLWLLPAAGLILLPLYENMAFAASLLQLAVLLCFNRKIRQYGYAAVVLYGLSSVILFYFLAPAKINQELFYLALHCGLSTAVFAFCLRAMLILDDLTHSQQHEQQSLTLQLSHRVAMYSSIPSTLLIALVLHGATALDISRYLLRYEAEQHQLSEQISQRLISYLTQVTLASNMLAVSDTAVVLPVLTAQRPEFISALKTDATGRVEAFYKADLPQTAKPGSSVADRSYFTEPRRTGTPYISDTFQGRNLGQDQLFAVSTPVLDQQQMFQGVLEVSVNLSQLTNTITPTDTDISHRILLDREQKKIWGTADNNPLGQYWSIGAQSDPAERKYLRYSWFNTFGPVMMSTNAAHLLLISYVTPGQWQLKYFIDTDNFIQRYHLFLALAMLIALILLEAITALSRSFISRYTTALEQLAHNASGWQPDDLPQPRLVFQQSAEEIETLANTLSDMQHRVRASRRAMQHSMQQIVTLNNDLEERVRLRTAELSSERDKATQLASIKTRFLANMSHEIRTPITVIKGFTEQLMTKVTGSDVALVQRIHQNTEHLQSLVDDILDTAKIDEGKMKLELQDIALQPFLAQLTDNISTLATQKGLHLQVSFASKEPLCVSADPFRLRQILLNLLSNAIKFTAQGQITLDVQQQADHGVTITVTDQGIGIKPEQLPQLFSAFSQADSSTSRNFGGTGLGLYISQQLAEAMQMRITVQSTPGLGSAFTLQIPAELISRTASPHQLQMPASKEIRLKAGRLLIVDDVADIRALIASYLEQQPLTLSYAADGKAAVTLCSQQTFDLILMDQQMPELDGFSAAQQIRQLGVTTPIISLSADVFEDPEKQFSTVFNQTMTKPFSKQQLLEAIASQQDQSAANVARSAVQEPHAIVVADDEDELVNEYRQTLPSYAAQIQQLYQDRQLEALSRLLHQIKGTSACFGLTQISSAAQAAQQAIKTGTIDTDTLNLVLTQLLNAPKPPGDAS